MVHATHGDTYDVTIINKSKDFSISLPKLFNESKLRSLRASEFSRLLASLAAI